MTTIIDFMHHLSAKKVAFPRLTESPSQTALGGWRNQVIAKVHTPHVLKPIISDASFLPLATPVVINTNTDLYTSLPDALPPTIFGQIVDQNQLSNGLVLWKAIIDFFD